MYRRVAAVVLIIVATSTPESAAPNYDPSPFGINGVKLMHMRGNPNIWENARKPAKVMKDAGIYWDRLELWWSAIEPEKGKFDWAFPDKVAEFYREQGIHAMVILCYHSAWSDGMPPRDADERARYANYVYQVVNRYKDTYKVWEIWNEPNIPTFWPNPNVEHYTLMLKEAYKAAKRADPECTVLAACTSGAGTDFIRGIYENGGWGCCDGISIHPYSMCGGPIPQRLDRILRLTNRFIAGTGKPKSLWITEMGWTTHRPELDERQAIYLFQSYVMALANGVEKLFWFDLADWSEKWGIVRRIDPLDAKPSYKAFRLLTERMGSPGRCAEFQGYLKMPEGVACYVFEKSGGERILILWSSDSQARDVQLPTSEKLSAVDVFGGRVDVCDGRLSVGPAPIIVTGADMGKVGNVSWQFNPYLEQKGRNLLNNGSLDILHGDSPAWWAAGRFDGTAKDGDFAATDDGRDGSKCVSISKSGGRAAWDACLVPVEAGRKYRLSAWVKMEDATGNNQIGLFWYGGSMWPYRGEVRSETVTGTHDWMRVSVVGTAPKDAVFVRANLISENNSGATRFDDVMLVEE